RSPDHVAAAQVCAAAYSAISRTAIGGVTQPYARSLNRDLGELAGCISTGDARWHIVKERARRGAEPGRPAPRLIVRRYPVTLPVGNRPSACPGHRPPRAA